MATNCPELKANLEQCPCTAWSANAVTTAANASKLISLMIRCRRARVIWLDLSKAP